MKYHRFHPESKALSLAQRIVIQGDVRRNCIYTCGVFGFTVLALSWLQRRDQTPQFKQFFHTKQGASGGDHVEWVLADDARPAGGQRPQSAIRVVKPNPVLMPVPGVKDQFEFLQMKGMVRMSYLKTSAFNVTHGRSCLRTPTRCANRSSGRSKRSCYCANTLRPMNRPGGASSGSWRAGTTYAACTAALATARRLNSRTSTLKGKPCRLAGCPPAGSVMVVRGDPPPARGQPATQRLMEARSHQIAGCKSVRRTGSISDFAGDRTPVSLPVVVPGIHGHQTLPRNRRCGVARQLS
ncbi:hypothetical protein OKW27_004067 [Paraburkholderia sp. 35.1]